MISGHPYIKTALKTGVSGLILYIVFRAIDPQQLLEVMRKARPGWLLWAVLWFTVSKLIGAFRYKELLRTEGIYLGNGQQLRLYWLGMYYNLLLPGGISGDGYKIKKLMDDFAKPFRRLFSITLFDRVSGVLALGQLCLVLACWLPPLQRFWWIWLLALGSSIPASKILFDKMIGASGQLWARTTVQSMGVQLTQLTATLGIVFALQQAAQWPAYALVFLISSVVAMLPFTIGGAGAREITFLWGARVLALDAEQSVAIAFLFYLISTGVSLWGMVYSFKSEHLQPSAPGQTSQENNIN